ncbi:MAG: HAD family hydrolase, partial [Saprospiraceae bacterium]|nr:HAD family hydrolase [Saprospiraceae bacterium]MCB0683708.1 HAD family hydrolase [Saprospiraceae bacterium]
MSPFKVIAFDADDTLWVNEPIFTETQEKFKAIVGPYLHPDGKDLEDILYQTELRNLRLFGYGIKGFTLSMIETGIEISRGKMTATE